MGWLVKWLQGAIGGILVNDRHETNIWLYKSHSVYSI